jgi:outer membrane lipoprotein-sorting protein
MKKNRAAIVITAVFAILLILCFHSSSAQQTSCPSPEDLWQKLMEVNPGLQDYSVGVNINANVKFMLLNPDLNLEGTYYFKKPDKHKLQLKRSYNFLEKYPNIFGWELPELSQHNSTVKEVSDGGKKYFVVILIPKVKRSDLQRQEFWIDSSNFTVPRQVFMYDGEGRITVDVTYRRDQQYWLYDRMTANFSFPKMKLNARALATYGNYRTNLGLNDEFFASNK